MYKIPRKYKRKNKRKPIIAIGYDHDNFDYKRFDAIIRYTGTYIPRIGESIIDSNLKYRLEITDISYSYVEGKEFVCLSTRDKIEFTDGDGARFVKEEDDLDHEI